jgi:ribonuclease HII
MVVLGGIDEAGLGPILGPLTVGFAALRTEPETPDPWSNLASIVAPSPEAGDERLVVADSKQVFSRDPRGHARLERTALTFLSMTEARNGELAPTTGHELFASAPPGLQASSEELARHPWYDELRLTLPLWTEPERVAQHRRALAGELTRTRTELVACGVRVLPEGQLNAAFERTGSKAVALWEVVADLIEYLWREFGQEDLELVVDRQGGRIHYAGLLASRFPFESLQVVVEEAAHSEYRLADRTGSRRMRLHFRPKAEEGSFAVALGSCCAKYAREVGMEAFNRYFSRLGPELEPTAGYVTDARRWLRDADALLERTGVERELLVRSR